MDAPAGENFPRDYTLGSTFLEKYEAKVNSNRNILRVVNEVLWDNADLYNLGAIETEIVKNVYEDTGRNWEVPNAEKDCVGMIQTLLERW